MIYIPARSRCQSGLGRLGKRLRHALEIAVTQAVRCLLGEGKNQGGPGRWMCPSSWLSSVTTERPSSPSRASSMTAPKLRECLAGTDGNVVVDLLSVLFLDSSGIAAL